LYLVDATGVVVDEYGPAYADFDLPIVDGLAARAKGGARGTAKAGANGRRRGGQSTTAEAGGDGTVDPARAALAARVIADMAAQPSLSDKVSQIDVSDVHDAVVMLEGDPTLLRLGEDEFADRLQQYLDLGDALRERVSVIDYVDLRFPERLYVRPAKGAAVAPAAGVAQR
ncbi:MAG: cell division protein FtsQ, partial [Acidobacteria bacterium]|nr:cell division protein FtsQ [Acidobacteriota bacterium]